MSRVLTGRRRNAAIKQRQKGAEAVACPLPLACLRTGKLPSSLGWEHKPTFIVPASNRIPWENKTEGFHGSAQAEVGRQDNSKRGELTSSYTSGFSSLDQVSAPRSFLSSHQLKVKMWLPVLPYVLLISSCGQDHYPGSTLSMTLSAPGTQVSK